MKLFRVLCLVVSGALVGAVLVYAILLRPAFARGRQVRTCADMNTVATYLAAYRGANQAYPRRLAEAVPVSAAKLFRDGFGYLLHYESAEEGYVLVSFGRDGRPDTTDYWALRSALAVSAHTNPASVAGQPDADQVLTDLGWVRSGCK